MAQEQPQREAMVLDEKPINYGDVFNVSGQVTDKPVLAEDAASMQAAEKIVMGHSPLGGPASLMQSAASINVQAGLVDPNSRRTNEGIRVTVSEVDGNRILTESVHDEVVGQYVEPKYVGAPPATEQKRKEPITIGEALEAVALSAGDEPIDKADAAAIEAAEMRALGTDAPQQGGLGIEARVAANWNSQMNREEFMATIDDVLRDAGDKLPSDRPVTREDAEVVLIAEVENDPERTTTIGGVGEMMVTAARLNQT